MSNRTRCGPLLLLPAVLPVALAVVVAAIVLAPQSASAQTPFVPYFGKNSIRYTNFRWNIYTTDHFEIYYYPEEEQHLERVAGYAESAYQHVSSDLKHDLAFKVPLIIFKTSSEFQQENVIPGAAQEGVGAFAEPTRDRMLVPLDDPPDLLYRTITHELTHIFQFDIIPTSLIRRNLPLWLNEGGADYETGIWEPLDLMTVRDAAVTDTVPKMSHMEGYGGFNNPRLIYNLGHACFEFIESRWGKEGVRQFLFALRKSVIGGGDSAYEEAFKLKDDEFDQQFDRYLKERFKPFRDKERPADYGRNLAPNPEKSAFNEAVSIEPSPSGDLIAIASGNRKDGELDIILISAKDGSVIRNLTNGFDQSKGFEYITEPGGRFITVPWMSWSPSGDRLAYFVRAEKTRTLIVENVLTRKIEQRIAIKDVDNPESPDFSPDGKKIVFAGLQNAIGDLFILDLQTEQVTNITKDEFADSGPTWSPDGKYIVYVSRVSGNEKLFRIDPTNGMKTQITFGTHDDASVQFVDPDTMVSSVDGDGSESRRSRSRRGAQRQHLQPLDAEHEERRAAGVHRRRRRQLLADRAAPGRQQVADRLHQLLQGRLRAAHARAEGSDHHRVGVRLRRARADHRLPGAAAAHAHRGEQAQEGDVRETVPRRAAAREHRRDERRQRVRRIRRHLQRRAGRQAVQPVRAVDRAVPHAVVRLHQSGAPVQLRGTGVLADAVLLRPALERLLRSVDRAAGQSQPGGSDHHRAGRQRHRHLSVQPVSTH